MTDDYIKANKEAWEETFERHQKGWGMDISSKILEEGFSYLEKEVIEELRGLNLAAMTACQFCCNNGRELLSIVKLGAKSGMGFDIAENFIAEANRLAQKTGLNCEFVASNILEIDESYHGRFDLLFISIGALCWFQDLDLFFKKGASVLKEKGIVIINESHPFTNILALPGEDGYEPENPKKPVHSYFKTEPWIETQGMDYVGGTTYDSKPFYNFSHTFSEIINALAGNGIRVKKLREFEKDISRGFQPVEHQGIPLSYVLVGEKWDTIDQDLQD